jgi:uncharacterized protein YdcH (DUF465 family)
MSHTPHELHEEFPQQAAKIHQLKAGDAQFAELAEAYHELNRTIHRIEIGVEAVDDPVLEDFKKQRLRMKDEIAVRLSDG